MCFAGLNLFVVGVDLLNVLRRLANGDLDGVSRNLDLTDDPSLVIGHFDKGVRADVPDAPIPNTSSSVFGQNFGHVGVPALGGRVFFEALTRGRFSASFSRPIFLSLQIQGCSLRTVADCLL